MRIEPQLQVKPGSEVDLSTWDPADTLGLTDKDSADKERAEVVERMAVLSKKLWADNRYALLVVLQGMDTAGKDGTIRQVLSGINPRDCHVVSFGRPTDQELDHDFLWRIHRACPARGQIGVFNRSHYEDVLIGRVRNLAPKEDIRRRYRQINDFERHLHENGTRIIKFFLHISRDEQKERLEERIKDPTKNWKMQPGDLDERKLWDKYQEAYEDAISKCSTEHAPWYIVPANKKWFRNLAIATIMCETLESLDLAWPKPKTDLPTLVVED